MRTQEAGLSGEVSKEELRRASYNATVVYLRRVHENLMILRVKPDFDIPSFKPGQFTTLGLGLWEERLEDAGGDELEELKRELLSLDSRLNGPELARDPSGREDLLRRREALEAKLSSLARKLIRRSYSISHPILDERGRFIEPREEGWLEFYVTIIKPGEVEGCCPILTPRLALLEEGARLFMGEKITGNYCLDGLGQETDMVFAATGTGEAPHNAMIAYLLSSGHRGRIVSIVCCRYRKDLAYLDVHRRLEKLFPNYRYVALTTRDLPAGAPKLYIQDFIRRGYLEELLGRPIDSTLHFFLCGNPAMVGAPKRQGDKVSYPEPEGVVEILEKGYPGMSSHPKASGCNIHYEEYW
jgi:ferredoxin--NADP+ reductase